MEKSKTPQEILNDARKEFEEKFAVMLERAGRENGESSTEWLERIELFFATIIKAFIEAEIVRLKGLKIPYKDKRNDPYNEGSADSYNEAIDDQIAHFTQLLETLRR